MEENNLSETNFLKINGLFGSGVFIFKDKPDVGLSYEGQYERGILNIFYSKGNPHPTLAQAVPLVKLLAAVKWNGSMVNEQDLALINFCSYTDQNPSLMEVLKKFDPKKAIIWTDEWQFEVPEIPFFESKNIENFEILRFHNLRTILVDPDRKKQCWLATKAFFGMK